jgi:hypothetical protein
MVWFIEKLSLILLHILLLGIFVILACVFVYAYINFLAFISIHFGGKAMILTMVLTAYFVGFLQGSELEEKNLERGIIEENIEEDLERTFEDATLNGYKNNNKGVEVNGVR